MGADTIHTGRINSDVSLVEFNANTQTMAIKAGHAKQFNISAGDTVAFIVQDGEANIIERFREGQTSSYKHLRPSGVNCGG